MNQEQFEVACGKTLQLLQRIAKERGSAPEGWRPERYTEDPTAWRHLSWMLTQAALFHAQSKIEKANRWLGFVQGVLAGCGVQLDELKQANMPEGETFDAQKV